jgi:hypothetical protein
MQRGAANHESGCYCKINDGCISETVTFVPIVKPQEVNHANVDQVGRYRS